MNTHFGLIGVLARDAEDRDVVGRELEDRSGRDYDLAIWSTPEAALAALHDVRTSVLPVVLLIACQGGADGLEFLARAGSIHPRAKRTIVLPVG